MIFVYVSEMVNFDIFMNLYGLDEINGINLICSYCLIKLIIEFICVFVLEGKNIYVFECDGVKFIVMKVVNYNELYEYIIVKVVVL